MLFDTTASMAGEECRIDDKGKHNYGFTWANKYKIHHGSGNKSDGPSYFFDMAGDEYELGITREHEQHLFIKNGMKECYL